MIVANICYKHLQHHLQNLLYTSININSRPSKAPTWMNSMNGQSGLAPAMETSHFGKISPVDLTLTYEQYLIIQHFLPKRFALHESKPTKKSLTNSAIKLGQEEVSHRQIDLLNVSRISQSRASGGMENTEEMEGRSKRVVMKKVDKYLQEEPAKNKRGILDIGGEDQLAQWIYILAQLKKNKNSYPFLHPVDPQLEGALNYFEIIKEPMDLATIEANLNSGFYSSAGQFHAHINQIWENSYTFNEKWTSLYKLTSEMEKFYKGLISGQINKKVSKLHKIRHKQELSKRQDQEEDRRKSSNAFGLKDNWFNEENE